MMSNYHSCSGIFFLARTSSDPPVPSPKFLKDGARKYFSGVAIHWYELQCVNLKGLVLELEEHVYCCASS